MLLQWALLQNTEKDKGTKRQRSIRRKVQASSASVGPHLVYVVIDEGKFAGRMSSTGAVCSVYLPVLTGLHMDGSSYVPKWQNWHFGNKSHYTTKNGTGYLWFLKNSLVPCYSSKGGLCCSPPHFAVPINRSSPSVTRINSRPSKCRKC